MRRVLVLAAIVAGCGDDDRSRDAAVDADAAPNDTPPDGPGLAIELDPPLPPEEATLPDLRPCLPGWVETTSVGGVTVCAPFGGTRRDCEGPTMQLPSSSECQLIGPACPSGPFPDDAPPTAIYVLAGATGGDGTRAAPFGTIGQGVAAATAGGIVVIGKGEYAENVVIDESLTLRGTCVAETRLLGLGEDEETIDIEPPEGAEPIEVELRAMYVTAPLKDAVSAYRAALTIEDTFIEPYSTAVSAGELHMRRVLVRGDQFTPGIACQQRCDLEDIVLDGLGSIGILGFDEEIHIENAAFIAHDGRRHIGVSVSSIGRVEMTGIAADRSGVSFASGDAQVQLTMASVENNGSISDFSSRSMGQLSQVWARGGIAPRITVGDEAIVRVSRAVFEGGALDGANDGSTAIHVGGGTLSLERVVIEDHYDLGMLVLGGAIRGNDIVVRDVRAGPDLATGFGAFAADGTIDLTRARFERCSGAAVFGYSLGTLIALTDTIVRDGGDDLGQGFAIGAFGGAVVELERVLVERAPVVSVVATGARTRITGTDLDVRDTHPVPADDAYGRAIDVEGAAEVDLERVSLSRSHDLAVAAVDRAHVRLRETRILEALSRRCSTSDCAMSANGIAVGSYGSTVELDGFEVRRAALCGVHFVEESMVELRRGLIAENAIGVCVDRDDYDLATLEDEVRYDQNGQNLDARRLTVPQPIPPPPIPEL